MKKRTKIIFSQLTVFTLITAALIGLRFLMPWLGERLRIDYWYGIGYFGAQLLPEILILALLLFIPRNFGVRISNFRPQIRRISPLLILFGVLLVFAAQLVVSPLLLLIPGDFMQNISNDLVSVMESGFWPMFTIIFVKPLVEEWIYRGIIQTSLGSFMGMGKAIIIMALLSGMAEITPQTGIVVGASSLIYGSIFFIQGSLPTVYMIHVLCNGFAYLLYLFFGSSSLIREELANYEFEYLLLWVGAVVLLGLTAWWVRVKSNTIKVGN